MVKKNSSAGKQQLLQHSLPAKKQNAKTSIRKAATTPQGKTRHSPKQQVPKKSSSLGFIDSTQKNNQKIASQLSDRSN